MCVDSHWYILNSNQFYWFHPTVTASDGVTLDFADDGAEGEDDNIKILEFTHDVRLKDRDYAPLVKNKSESLIGDGVADPVEPRLDAQDIQIIMK